MILSRQTWRDELPYYHPAVEAACWGPWLLPLPPPQHALELEQHGGL